MPKCVTWFENRILQGFAVDFVHSVETYCLVLGGQRRIDYERRVSLFRHRKAEVQGEMGKKRVYDASILPIRISKDPEIYIHTLARPEPEEVLGDSLLVRVVTLWQDNEAIDGTWKIHTGSPIRYEEGNGVILRDELRSIRWTDTLLQMKEGDEIIVQPSGMEQSYMLSCGKAQENEELTLLSTAIS